MATFIKTLTNKQNQILPRTVSSAVVMEDGTTLEFSIKNSNTNFVKVAPEVAEALGVVEGSTLSSLLISLNKGVSTTNTLATAEIITE